MENLTVAVIIAFFAWSIFVQTMQALQIRRCMELLAARSYGEYATGKAKLTHPKPSEAIDPGF
jgi:hypothetical protein